MQIPNSKLRPVDAVGHAPIETTIGIDPDQPHRYWPGAWAACRVCRGSRENPIHTEPLLGWPE